MQWIEFAVYTTDEALDDVCACLAGVGLDQVSIEESSARVSAHLDSLVKFWDYADVDALAAKNGPCVKAYIAKLPENEPLVEAARRAVERLRLLEPHIAKLLVQETAVDDEDWANSWKQYYKPIPIGKRLLVCPSWEKDSLDTAALDARELLLLDPGMVFGTGTHHTTRLCLEYIEQSVRRGCDILDVGCGSGILAIAALLLGARRAVLVDIDPVAERVVRENAAMNGIAEGRFCVYTGDVINDARLRASLAGKYDIVAANIVADVILALTPYIKAFVKPGGLFLCSGIIDERADEVRSAIKSQGLSFLSQMRSMQGADAMNPEGGWTAMCFEG